MALEYLQLGRLHNLNLCSTLVSRIWAHQREWTSVWLSSQALVWDTYTALMQLAGLAMSLSNYHLTAS